MSFYIKPNVPETVLNVPKIMPNAPELAVEQDGLVAQVKP